MKKRLFTSILAIAMASCLLSSCGSGGNSNSGDGATGEKIVCGVTEWEPMNYKDENGEWTGFETEFARAVAEKLGMTAEFQLVEWGNKYVELDSGAIDCIWNGFTSNVADEDGIQRSDKVDFSHAYMINQQCIVVRKENLDQYQTQDDLKGKLGSAEAGSAGESFAKEAIGDDSKYVPKTAQMETLTELMAGTVDFSVMDILLAKQVVGSGDYESLAIVDAIELPSEVYSIGFKKGSDLTEKVNGAMEEMAADGSLQKLADKYGLGSKLITDFDE